MINQSILEDTEKFLEYLGLNEEPIGIYFSDNKPENAFGPNTGPKISRELEEQGQIDMQGVLQNFSCVIGNIWRARKKRGVAYISAEDYGCPGGVYYCSMLKPYLRFIENYVSTGFEGTHIHGERYMPSPEKMRAFMEEVEPRNAPAKYCLFKPLSLFTDDEIPEFIIFFARPEVLTGLFIQATFTTGDMDCVAAPFGAACTNLVGWPLYYKEKGVEKAVLGGLDPSARKYMKTDELTFTIPWSLYQKMLKKLPESVFNFNHAWPSVRNKINLSAKKWGEVD